MQRGKQKEVHDAIGHSAALGFTADHLIKSVRAAVYLGARFI